MRMGDTREIAEKAYEVYRKLCQGKKKPPRRGTIEYNQQLACVEMMIEAVWPDIRERIVGQFTCHMLGEMRRFQEDGKIVPLRKVG